MKKEKKEKRKAQNKADRTKREEVLTGGIREVKKGFCLLSVAYVVLGLVLLIWPDLSQKTFCYVFGVGMIIFGGAHIILYFTKDRFESVLQMDMVSGIVGLATGAYILLKMEYVMDILPFVLGIVALLGAAVKVQNAFDLRRLREEKWYIMLVLALILFIFGGLLVANPFDETQDIVERIIGVSLIVDGVGNLAGIFWIAISFKRLSRVTPEKEKYDIVDVAEEEVSEVPSTSKITVFHSPANVNAPVENGSVTVSDEDDLG